VSKLCLSAGGCSASGTCLPSRDPPGPADRFPGSPAAWEHAAGSERLSLATCASAGLGRGYTEAVASKRSTQKPALNPQALRRRGRRLGVFETVFGLRLRITWGSKGAGALGRTRGSDGFSRAGFDITCKRGRSGVSSDSSWRGTCRKRRTRASRL
jgi:hypothetical protein